MVTLCASAVLASTAAQRSFPKVLNMVRWRIQMWEVEASFPSVAHFIRRPSGQPLAWIRQTGPNENVSINAAVTFLFRGRVRGHLDLQG